MCYSGKYSVIQETNFTRTTFVLARLFVDYWGAREQTISWVRHFGSAISAIRTSGGWTYFVAVVPDLRRWLEAWWMLSCSVQVRRPRLTWPIHFCRGRRRVFEFWTFEIRSPSRSSILSVSVAFFRQRGLTLLCWWLRHCRGILRLALPTQWPRNG